MIQGLLRDSYLEFEEFIDWYPNYQINHFSRIKS